VPEPMAIGKTVLVYMASDNNLSAESAEDVLELASGYVPEWFDQGRGDVLLIYRHGYKANPHLIRMSLRDGGVAMDTIVSYPAQNSCDGSTFRKVMDDAFGQYPSDERGLIFSSHGTGWLPEGYYSNPVDYAPAQAGPSLSGAEHGVSGSFLIGLPVTEDPYAWMVKAIGHESDDSEMDIDTLKNSLLYHLDWFAMDCCLMGGVEVAYQLKDVCDYIIASQTEIMADGFPYYDLMEIAFRNGSDAASRVKDMADLYFKHYDAKTDTDQRSATISAVKCSELPALAASVKEILSAGGKENTDTLLFSYGKLKYVQRYFRYDKHWFYDLDDYISQVCPNNVLYSDFSRTLEDAVIYKNATLSFLPSYGGFYITHFSGLSTYVPLPYNSYLREYYERLDWGRAVGF